jgi:hypothetical protein
MNDQLTTTTRRGLVVILIVVTAVALVSTSVEMARAAIPGVSATVVGPSPNQVAAGSTVPVTATFSSTDIGPLTVSVELQGTSGFGTLRLDTSATSSELTGCLEAGTSVNCTWDGDAADSPQTLGLLLDVDPAVAPFSWANLVAVVSSSSDTDIYASYEIFSSPPIGSTSLSGNVIGEGGTPVAGACIFVISSPLFVSQTITGSDGSWAISGLPDDYTFIVAVVPPFTSADGPCVTQNGPPPIPGPGEPQPVFIDDIWIDLSDPALTGGQGDPYVFAVNAGATVFSASASGLEACLSTAPASAIPRPSCLAAVTTSPTTIADTLPLTGTEPTMIGLLALTLVAGGVCLVMATRRPGGST